MPRNTFEEMKYLEIMIVSDHSMVGVPLRARVTNVDLDANFWLFSFHFFSFFFAHTQFKRHKTKQHTRNQAKSVVNLVDAVSKPLPPFEKCALFAVENVHTHTHKLRGRSLDCHSLFSMCNPASLIEIPSGQYSVFRRKSRPPAGPHVLGAR